MHSSSSRKIVLTWRQMSWRQMISCVYKPYRNENRTSFPPPPPPQSPFPHPFSPARPCAPPRPALPANQRRAPPCIRVPPPLLGPAHPLYTKMHSSATWSPQGTGGMRISKHVHDLCPWLKTAQELKLLDASTAWACSLNRNRVAGSSCRPCVVRALSLSPLQDW